MGLFNFLFGKKQLTSSEQNLASIDQTSTALKKPAQNTPNVSFIGNLMSIDSLNFFGSYKKSKSGKWIISWNDSDRSRHIGGHREGGHGDYILYDIENNVIVPQRHKLERPNNGSIANDGTFCLEDWCFGNDLSGIFYVFSKQGDILLKKNLTANIYNSGISNSGLLAVCQTASSRTDDGNKLHFFDIANKKELFSIYPPTGWADSYEFNENKQKLIVHIKGVGKFRYEANGVFIDHDKYQQNSLNANDYVRVILIAQDILNEPNVNVDKERYLMQ